MHDGAPRPQRPRSGRHVADPGVQRRPPRTRRLFLIVGTLIATVVLVMSIAIAAHVFHHNGQPGTAPSESANAAGDLATSFAAVEQSVDADVGVAVAAVGRTGTVLTFGGWTSGPAWSTSKVPLVLAALREPPTPTVAVARCR